MEVDPRSVLDHRSLFGHPYDPGIYHRTLLFYHNRSLDLDEVEDCDVTAVAGMDEVEGDGDVLLHRDNALGAEGSLLLAPRIREAAEDPMSWNAAMTLCHAVDCSFVFDLLLLCLCGSFPMQIRSCAVVAVDAHVAPPSLFHLFGVVEPTY